MLPAYAHCVLVHLIIGEEVPFRDLRSDVVLRADSLCSVVSIECDVLIIPELRQYAIVFAYSQTKLRLPSWRQYERPGPRYNTRAGPGLNRGPASLYPVGYTIRRFRCDSAYVNP